jgi:hypothetical protein
MGVEGGCVCGDCRYVLDYEALPVLYACHCRDCQTMTGGGFVLQTMVPRSRFQASGDITEWTRHNSGGALTTHRFCVTCRTRLWSDNEARPGMVLVRAGTLDRSDEAAPAVHMWTSRRQPWIGLPGGAEIYPQAVPAERIRVILAPNFA